MINGSHYQLTENGRQPGDGLGQPNPFSLTPDEVVRRGQEAMERKRRSFDDFMLIAGALEVGCTEIMRAVHTNKPIGRRYATAMDKWLFARSFHLIDKCTRSHLLECLQHLAEIAKWRATLSEAKRFSFNHPTTVLRKWKAATVVPDPNVPPKTSTFAKLKDANVDLQERLHRAEREVAAGGGGLWASEDTPDTIANVMLAHLSASKAERVARAILRKLDEKKTTSSKFPAKQVSDTIGGA
jgi:hypothetical protein